MSIFKRAKISYKKRDYIQAVKFFEKVLNEEELPLDDLIFSCEKIEEINQRIRRRDDPSFLKKFLALSRESENFGKIISLSEKLFKIEKNISFFLDAFDFSLEKGSFESARLLAKKILRFFYLEKRGRSLDEFLEKNEKFISVDELNLWKMRGALYSGRRKEFYEILKTIREKEELFPFAFQEFLNITEKRGHYWNSYIPLQKLCIETLADDQFFILINKKRLLKQIINYWMEMPIDHDVLKITIKICKRYCLRILGQALAKYLGDHNLEQFFLEQDPLGDIQPDKDLDFGGDLFSQKTEEGRESDLLRNILFLEQVKNYTKMEEQLDELRQLNPEHPLLKKKMKTLGQRDSQKVYEDLLDEFKKREAGEEKKDKDRYFKKMAKYYKKSYIQKNYEAMVVGLHLINLSSVALDVIGMVNRKKLNDDEKINLTYLELEILLELKEFYKIRDRVDDLINDSPMTSEEILPILYLRGEAYLGLKDYKNAWHCFREIDQLKSNYRLVRQRLDYIEKYK